MWICSAVDMGTIVIEFTIGVVIDDIIEWTSVAVEEDIEWVCSKSEVEGIRECVHVGMMVVDVPVQVKLV